MKTLDCTDIWLMMKFQFQELHYISYMSKVDFEEAII